MELTGERHIPASRAATWAALNDPATPATAAAPSAGVRRQALFIGIALALLVVVIILFETTR